MASIIDRIKSVFGTPGDSKAKKSEKPPLDGHDPAQHDAVLAKIEGATSFRYPARDKDPGVFEALDKITAASREKFSAYNQPSLPDVVIADHLKGTEAMFVPNIGKNGTLAITEKAARSPDLLLYLTGHEWGHDFLNNNMKNIGKLNHDKRFQVKEHDAIAEKYTHELKDFIYSLKGFSDKDKKEIYETILDGQAKEVFSDRMSVLMTCDPETAKKDYPEPRKFETLREEMVNRLADHLVFDEMRHPPANGSKDTDAEFAARAKRLLETRFAHPFDADRVKYFDFPGGAPPGCPVPPQETPAVKQPPAKGKEH